MSSQDAFRTLTSLLVDILRVRLAGSAEDLLDSHQIQPVSPAALEEDSSVRLGVYFHHVSRRSGAGSQEPKIQDETKVRPPLRLDAHYILTAFPSSDADDEATRIADQQAILGTAIQALYDNQRLEPATLPAAFGDDELTITFDDRPEHELLDLWQTFGDVPKFPTVAYRVGPVVIESTQQTAFERVEEREFDVLRD